MVLQHLGRRLHGVHQRLYRYIQADTGTRRGTLDIAVDTLLLLMAPMAPHITAELWVRRHDDEHVHETALAAGRSRPSSPSTRSRWSSRSTARSATSSRSPTDIDAAEAEALALASTKVQSHLDGATPKKVIVRPPKLVNIVH